MLLHSPHVWQAYNTSMKAKDWARVRKAYLKGKQNHQGYFICEYGCWTDSPEVHHKLKRSTHPHLASDLENLTILCPKHHQEIHQ